MPIAEKFPAAARVSLSQVPSPRFGRPTLARHSSQLGLNGAILSATLLRRKFERTEVRISRIAIKATLTIVPASRDDSPFRYTVFEHGGR